MTDKTPQAHIYQIYYSEQTRAALDPGFSPLDNLGNERPDWREYWPIRNYLLNHELTEGDYYGFLSPKFHEKTHLSAANVHTFVRSCAPDADVIAFSPFFDQIAVFANSFEQGIYNHPNTLEAFRRSAALIHPGLDITQCLMSSANTIYCNYFVAKARFWRTWLQKCELIFSIAEAKRGELAQALNVGTSHDLTIAPTKVFVIERVASALLATDRSWSVRVYDPISLPHRNPVSELALIVMDALKVAYHVRGSRSYWQAYVQFREQTFGKQPAAPVAGSLKR